VASCLIACRKNLTHGPIGFFARFSKAREASEKRLTDDDKTDRQTPVTDGPTHTHTHTHTHTLLPRARAPLCLMKWKSLSVCVARLLGLAGVLASRGPSQSIRLTHTPIARFCLGEKAILDNERRRSGGGGGRRRPKLSQTKYVGRARWGFIRTSVVCRVSAPYTAGLIGWRDEERPAVFLGRGEGVLVVASLLSAARESITITPPSHAHVSSHHHDPTQPIHSAWTTHPPGGAMAERPKREKVLSAADLKRKADREALKAAREGKKSRLDSLVVRGCACACVRAYVNGTSFMCACVCVCMCWVTGWTPCLPWVSSFGDHSPPPPPNTPPLV
jgi:hypothetical protein